MHSSIFISPFLLLTGYLCQAQTSNNNSSVDQEKRNFTKDKLENPTSNSEGSTNLFRAFAGSVNAIYNDNQAKGSFDLAVQTYHFYLITGRRYKNDSIHELLIDRKQSMKDIYRGFHFYLLNRAAIDFDTLRAIANNHITSILSVNTQDN